MSVPRQPIINYTRTSPVDELARDQQVIAGGVTIYRIRAVRAFGSVKAGDFGGFIESERNLSHDGECWVGDDARVYGEAVVSGNARVYGRAQVYGGACVEDRARCSATRRCLNAAGTSKTESSSTTPSSSAMPR
jgi:hypothetical protein